MTNTLEPRDGEIAARLVAQGAMLEELLAVLPSLAPASALDDARRAIVDENVLRRPSIASRAKIFSKLRLRYFRPTAPESTARFVRAMQAAEDRLQAGLLAYVMLLWNDALVYRLGWDWLAPRLASPGFAAETGDIERELERLAAEQQAIASWGPASRRKVAGNYLSLLRDCGYARGSARKVLRRPFIAPDVVLFAVELLLGGGEAPARALEDRLFTAMGLSVSDVIAALSELRQQGRIEFAVQGDVVHLALQE